MGVVHGGLKKLARVVLFVSFCLVGLVACSALIKL